MRNKTHELALASLLAALAATLLSLGTLVPLATYAAPLLASVALLVARQECRASLAWGCWLVSAALGLLLAADREAALLYAFFGWYPLLKPRLDALRPMPLRLGVKLLLCLVSVGSMYALALFVLQLEALAQEFADSSRALLWATALLGIALFLAYDQALARLTAAYQKRRTRRS
ncbi:MAG: hypothetical protein K6G54_08940 [Oscillospiraceae bacterium]|nr:hypothetical protein [Oscillospiraceae bacterium]